MQKENTPAPPSNSDQTADRVGVGRSDLFASLLDRKRSVELEMLDNDERSQWRERPDRAGWWLWMEDEYSHRTELILVGDGGTHVADDDDWEQAIGRPPSDARGESENYWEGTEITQAVMPGLWLYLANIAFNPENEG